MNKDNNWSNLSNLTNHRLTHDSQGQILVIFLLIMIVGLTLGLYLLSRTTTDISLTTKLSDSTRAFNAAEAGIEEAIRSSVGLVEGSPVPIASGVTYTVATTDLGNNGIYPPTRAQVTPIGKVFTVWLVPHDDSTGTILDATAGYTGAVGNNGRYVHLCFTSASPTPAVAVTAYWRQGTDYFSSYTGYDPDPSRNDSNNFNDTQSTLGNCPTGANGYSYRARIDFGTLGGDSSDFGQLSLRSGGRIPIVLLVRPVYAAVSLAAVPENSGLNPFPKQGESIESIGNVGQITRKITVNEPYVVPVPFLDHALYSTGTTANIEK